MSAEVLLLNALAQEELEEENETVDDIPLQDFSATKSTATDPDEIALLPERDPIASSRGMTDEAWDMIHQEAATAIPAKKYCGVSEVVIAHFLLAVSQIIYVFFYILSKVALRNSTAFIFAGIRITFAIVTLAPVAWKVDRFVPKTRKHWLGVVACGIFGVATNQVMTSMGIARAGAVMAALLQPMNTLVTALISILMKNEKFHWLKFFGLLAGAGGLTLMMRFDKFDVTDGTSIGAVMISIACLSTGLAVNLQRKVVESGVPPFSTTLYSFLFGGLIIACLFVYDAVNFDFSRLVESWETLPAIAYCGVIAMTITYSVQLWALMRTSPTVAGCYSVLQPPMAALVGIVLLGETLEWEQPVGSAIALIGLACVIYGRFLEQKKQKGVLKNAPSFLARARSGLWRRPRE